MNEWLNQGDPAATILLMGVAALAIIFVLSAGYYWIKALVSNGDKTR